MLCTLLPTGAFAANEELTPDSFVEYARRFKGVPYQSPGRSPSGFDCCGLVWYVCNHFGIDIGDGNQNDQINYGVSVPYDKTSYSSVIQNMEKGDLIFFDYYDSGYVNHVAIYTGDGNVINAESGGVLEHTLNQGGWQGRYMWQSICGIRRLQLDYAFPEIVSDTVKIIPNCSNGGCNGFSISFTAKDNVVIQEVYAKVWQYGDDKSSAKRIDGAASKNKDGTYTCNIEVNCRDFGVNNNEGIFYFNTYVSDGYNVKEYWLNEKNDYDSINLFRIIPDESIVATYKVTKDNCPIRCAPYEKFNNTDTKIASLGKGTQVSSVGKYINSFDHDWYKLEDGTWIYSENVRMCLSWSNLKNTVSHYYNKVVFYLNGQMVDSGTTQVKKVAVSVPQTQSMAAVLAASNSAYATYSVSGRNYSSGGGSHTYSYTYNTVYFDANGGSCNYSSRSYVAGSAYGWLPTPSRFGYTFDGWFTAPDGGTQVTGSTVCNANGVTYYAHWTRIILLQGSCGDTMNFVLYYDGELDITGSGEMTSHPWTKDYAERVLLVNLEGEITSIANSAFEGCSNLPNINLPDSIIEINNYAFANTGLTSLVLPQSIETLGNYILARNTGVKEITIPKTVTDISYALANSGIESVIFESGITSIPEYACCNAAKLMNVTIPETVTTIDYAAFSGCSSLENIAIPEAVTVIDSYAFDGTNLTSLTLPKHTVTLGSYILARNTGVKEITIPKTVTDAGSAFANSGIESIVFENGITSIPRYACCNATKLMNVTIPETVTTIDYAAFSGCSSLESIAIPEAVTKIDSYAFERTGLTGFTLSDSVTQFGSSVFKDCEHLESAVWNNVITAIPYSTFYGCTNLGEFSIPEQITEIQDSAFSNCDALKELIIPANVKSLGGSAFYDCDSLETVTIPDSAASIGDRAFYDCDALETITIPNSVTSIGSNIFAYCDKLKNVSLGTGITTIPEKAFFECPALESISLPYRVTAINSKAFGNCTALKEATILRNVTSIAKDAFSYPNILTVYGVAGTFAETYANDIGSKFVAIDKPATSVTLNKTELTVNKGASYQLIADIQPGDFTDTTAWKTGNSSVVTVSDNGLIKAVGIGEATVSFVAGNVRATCKVTVIQPVTGISLNKTSLSLDAGDTYTLTATVSPSNAANKSIVWSSSDESIASVDRNGVVTALKKGTATITAKAQDGSNVSRSCTVTVNSNLFVANSVEELQSSHPHAASCNDVWQYSEKGAEKLNVTFSTDTSVEEGSDYIYIFNADGSQLGKYTGAELAGKTVTVTGDTVKIKLVSDSTYCEYGFRVTDVTAGEAPHSHSYAAAVTAPTCTEKGYTTYACECGESYVADYVDALGHNYVDGKCTHCGADDPDYKPVLNEGKLVVSDTRAKAGEEVTVSVSIEDNPGVMVMALGIDYDKTKLELVGFEDGIMTGWKVATNAVWIGADDVTADGVILKLKFKVLEDVEDGDIQVSLLFSEGDIANHDEEIIMPGVSNGIITVYSHVPGDVTGDGKVNALDLVRLQRYLSGEAVEIGGSCDITGDGKINALDLVRLQRYLSGEDVAVY